MPRRAYAVESEPKPAPLSSRFQRVADLVILSWAPIPAIADFLDHVAALAAASRNRFFSLPVAFDPSESVGPYLAIVDRDADGRPYRFLDMGALIATHAFGENDPAVTHAIVESLP